MDLLTTGFPCLENPYPMDIHESPVTCCTYLADCPADLIPAFYSVGRAGTSKRAGFSEKVWPIDGGSWPAHACTYAEVIMTGYDSILHVQICIQIFSNFLQTTSFNTIIITLNIMYISKHCYSESTQHGTWEITSSHKMETKSHFLNRHSICRKLTSS